MDKFLLLRFAPLRLRAGIGVFDVEFVAQPRRSFIFGRVPFFP